MWFKNATIYKINSYPLFSISESLEPNQFIPPTGLDLERRGWIKTADDNLAYTQDNQVLITLRTDKKLLPTSVINEGVKALAEEIEEREGYKPGRKQLKEIKEQVVDSLLPKAFAVSTITRIWIDSKRNLVIVDAASQAKADRAIGALVQAGFRVQPIRTMQSPSTSMTGWLAENEAPTGFGLDQDAELVGRGEGRAKVRYSKHSLEGTEIQNHIAGGKQCTRLAMTWNERVSFVLTDTMTLKQIKPLDVIQEQAATNPDDDVFASGFALMTGEMGRLIDSLIQAFGGYLIESVNDDDGDDPLLEKAIDIVRSNKRVSISLVQRHLMIGYNRAARLVEAMEELGIVSPMDSSGNRTILKGN